MNTRWAAIALFAGTDIISTYIVQQFLRDIARELGGSAAIECADHLTISFRIICRC